MAARDVPAPHTPGSKEAFEAVYLAHHRAVLAYCTRRTSSADAWDAAAEVFLVAWRRLDVVPDGDGTLPWLLGVAYRVLSNQRRSVARRRRLAARAASTGDPASEVPEAQLIRGEQEAAVVAALASLPPTDREILQLSLWEELKPVDIAAILGIARSAVDKRFSRAKKRLAKELNRQSPNHGHATQFVDTDRGGT